MTALVPGEVIRRRIGKSAWRITLERPGLYRFQPLNDGAHATKLSPTRALLALGAEMQPIRISALRRVATKRLVLVRLGEAEVLISGLNWRTAVREPGIVGAAVVHGRGDWPDAGVVVLALRDGSRVVVVEMDSTASRTVIDLGKFGRTYE